MRPQHTLALCFFALVSIPGISSIAQNPVSHAQIVQKPNDNQLITLKGNTPPAAIAGNDRGRVSADMPMSGLVLVLRRSPEQQAAFDAFVARQYDANSPDYHHWLEPAEVGEKFGPALADIVTISSWLGSHGLAVEEVSKDRMTIRFSGTAGQVEEAFHTEIHNLQVKGVPHISNMTDPQIPMALEPVVLGPKQLHDFNPRPLHRLGGKVIRNAKTGNWERIAGTGTASGVRPEIGFPCGTGCQVEDVAPFDFAAIYNVLPLWNATTPINGAGQTIAIAGTSDVSLTDVSSFRSGFGLPAGLAPIIKLAHGTDPGQCTASSPTALNGYCTLDDQIENALDVEWSGAVAPGAQIELVVSGATSAADDTVFDSANYVVQNSVAKILNVSYGLCELGEGTTGNATYNTLWQTAASGGIAVFVATGDAGSPACDQGGDASGTPYPAEFGLSVNGLASTQYDTAVGGTDFNWGGTAAPYWNATNSTSNGSTAKGYIPEIPWNDSCTNPLALSYFQSWASALQKNGFSATSPTDAESACNFVLSWYQTIANNTNPTVDLSGFIDTIGGGGGVSGCTTSDGATVASCAGGYSTPSWQAGVSGIPTGGKRSIPDVSFFASNGFLGSAYLICVSDWGACVTKTTTAEPTGGVGEIGGTSAASPAMAGVMALINQKAGSSQGSPNAGLYQLAGKQTYSGCSTETVTSSSSSCYFNDVDTGTNSMPCAYSATASLNSPNCAITQTGDTIGLLSGYSAGPAYDMATGLGSLNVANVVNAWPAVVTGTATATVGVSAVPSTFTSAQGTMVTVTVTGASGTPTGTVVLSSGSFASTTRALSSGSITFSISPGTLPVGTDSIKASYSGDNNYAPASGTVSVTITQAPLLTPTMSVTPSATSIDSGQSLTVTAAITGAGAVPTGTVTISGGGYTSSAQTLATGSYAFAIPAGSLSAGTDTLTVTYSGDVNYAGATATTSVTVTASAYALAATAPAAIAPGGSATSTVSLSSTTDYSGTVTLTCALTTSPSGASELPTCSATSRTIAVTSGTPGGTGTVAVATTAATTSSMKKPPIGGWAEAGSGAMLALLVFFGIPARRRGWRAMLGVLVLLATLGSMAACGGGGSSSGGGGGGNPGTTAGSYTFTVTGTGSDAAKTTETTTFTVTVN